MQRDKERKGEEEKTNGVIPKVKERAGEKGQFIFESEKTEK